MACPLVLHDDVGVKGQSIASDAVRILAKVFHIEKRLQYSSASEKAAQRRQAFKSDD